MSFKITHVGLEDDVVASLAALMVSVVADDGSIGFLHPLSLEASARYWRDALGDPGRMVFVAWRAGDVVGTVTLFFEYAAESAASRRDLEDDGCSNGTPGWRSCGPAARR